MITNINGLYLELPTFGIYDQQSGLSSMGILYTRGDMRIYWSDEARLYMQQQGIASVSINIEAEFEGRNVATYNVSLAADGWLDISEIVLSLGVIGGLNGGNAGACGSPEPSDYEWPPVPSPYNLINRDLYFSFTMYEFKVVRHRVIWNATVDTPPYDGVAPIIDKYGAVRVLDGLDIDCNSQRRVVKQVGNNWVAAGSGHSEACYYQWTSLYGSGLYGRSCECWGEADCADECLPPHCPSPYDCQGVLQGGECQPKTKKRMAQIRYCNVDALTIERWCEVASERIEATQSERQEARAYQQLSWYWTPRTSGWHTRTRNLTKHYITVAWRGYPVEELKRIADGITYTPTCIIIDGDKAWYAVLADSVDIEIEEGGDLEIEFEVRECDRPVYESCNLAGCQDPCPPECPPDPMTGECNCPQ